MLTILQARTAPPKAVTASDAISLVDQAMNFVGSAIPKLVGVAYFLVVLALLWKLWQARKSGLSFIDLCALAIVFGLMR